MREQNCYFYKFYFQVQTEYRFLFGTQNFCPWEGAETVRQGDARCRLLRKIAEYFYDLKPLLKIIINIKFSNVILLRDVRQAGKTLNMFHQILLRTN